MHLPPGFLPRGGAELPSDVRRTGIRGEVLRLGRRARRPVRTNEEVVDTRSEAAAEAPQSSDRYPPIRDLAAIGDGRTVALVSLDGTMCWLPVPSLDSATVFASLLDVDNGGRFTLAPIGRSEVRRRYLPDTNVLETTFVTATGT